MAITKTKRTKRVLDPVDNTQIDYDKLADAIIRKQNRPGPQLIQDNPSSDTSGSSGIVVDNEVEQPTLQPPTIEPQNASAREMHVQHAMNSSLNMHETAQSSFLLALDQLFGGRTSKGSMVGPGRNSHSTRTNDHLSTESLKLLQSSLLPATKKAYARSWKLLLQFH